MKQSVSLSFTALIYLDKGSASLLTNNLRSVDAVVDVVQDNVADLSVVWRRLTT